MDKWKAALDIARSGESKYKILVQAIADDIEQGVLANDQRLPPQRHVADTMGISVQTVTNAYKELERQGLVRCEVGRGSFVSRRMSDRVATYILDSPERALVDFPSRGSCTPASTTSSGVTPVSNSARKRISRGYTHFVRLRVSSRTAKRPRTGSDGKDCGSSVMTS